MDGRENNEDKSRTAKVLSGGGVDIQEYIDVGGDT